jgi:hypothetical protein
MAPGQYLVDDSGAWSAPGVILGSGGSDRFLVVTPRTYMLDRELDDEGIHLPTDYDRFMADVWVGVVLTLMVFSCLCCMCSCMLYHRFQEWKRGGERKIAFCLYWIRTILLMILCYRQ